MTRLLASAATVIFLASVACGRPGFTQEVEETEIRVLGNVQNTLQSSEIERPFFETELPAASEQAFKIEFRTMDETGIKGFEAARLLQLGTFDIMAMQLGYISGDAPFVQGVDLPGVAPTLEIEREVVNAYREKIATLLEEKYNGKLLALWPFPGQAFFCRPEITGLADLNGLKVRVHNPAVAVLIEEFGGSAVSLSFPEVYQALQRGVIDCAITGTLPGNTSNWHEVTEYLYPLYVGWSIQTHVANLDFWNALPPEAQDLLTTEFAKFEETNWEAGELYTQDGVNCNTGQGDCRYGTVQDMTLVEVREEDRQLLQETAETTVLPAWAEKCGSTYEDCGQVWNETVGAAIGLTIE